MTIAMASVLTKTSGNDWTVTGKYSYLDPEFYEKANANFGDDSVSVIHLSHKDGRKAHIEYTEQDTVFFTCGKVNWSGTLEAVSDFEVEYVPAESSHG
jgi:hypothetical protein